MPRPMRSTATKRLLTRRSAEASYTAVLFVARAVRVVEPAEAAGGHDAAGVLDDEDLFAPELLDQGLGRRVLAEALDELGRVVVHEHAVVAAEDERRDLSGVGFCHATDEHPGDILSPPDGSTGRPRSCRSAGM